MNAKKGRIFNIQKFCLHDGEGIRTDVFFSGCNLRCAWCANPECRLPAGHPADKSREMSAEEIVREALKDKVFYDKSGGGVTLTGGEVLCQAEFAAELARALRAAGIHVAAETAACAEEETFRAFARETDFLFVDCKHYDEQKHVAGTGASNAPVLRNLAWLAREGREHCARIPVIPGYNDGAEDAEKFAALFARLGTPRVQILPFHQLGEKKYADYGMEYACRGLRQLHKEDLIPYAKILGAGGLPVQIGG